jgi:5-methylcytosine-specific restriction endonuclease McrA
LHIDHVYPLSKGGLDTLENVRPSHGKCNIVKWATLVY